MTNKVGIWDDILGKEEPTLLKKMVAIIVSQLGVLLFGVTLLVSMLWVSGFLTLPEYEENGIHQFS